MMVRLRGMAGASMLYPLLGSLIPSAVEGLVPAAGCAGWHAMQAGGVLSPRQGILLSRTCRGKVGDGLVGVGMEGRSSSGGEPRASGKVWTPPEGLVGKEDMKM